MNREPSEAEIKNESIRTNQTQEQTAAETIAEAPMEEKTYVRHFPVAASLCGSRTELGNAQTLGIYQDCFTEYLKTLHCDNIRLRRDFGAYWVIIRSKAHFALQRPQWNEMLRAEMHMARYSPYYIELDTALYNKDGAIVSWCRQQLCVLDLESHKPRRLDFLPALALAVCPGKSVTNERFDILTFTPGEQAAYDKTVRSHDVDSNGHMNNIAYVNAVLDAFSVHELEAGVLTDLEIQYIHECYEGEHDRVWRIDEGNRSRVLIRKPDGTDAVLAVLTFRTPFV